MDSKKTVRTTKSAPRVPKNSALGSLEKAVSVNKSTPEKTGVEEVTPVLDTVALRIEALQKGMMYSCILSGKDMVHYIGDRRIRWYSPAEDDYKESRVHDYQLRPLIAAQTNE